MAKLSLNQQRILIALDVIEQLYSRKLIAKIGDIFGDNVWDALRKVGTQESAQILLQKTPTCTVCAKGALIISHTLRFNQLTQNEVYNLGHMSGGHQLPEFSERMMAELETLFELNDFTWNVPYVSLDEQRKLVKWGYDNKLDQMRPTERLIFLMRQLILNGGKKFVLAPALAE